MVIRGNIPCEWYSKIKTHRYITTAVICKPVYLFISFTAPFSEKDLFIFKDRRIDRNKTGFLKSVFQYTCYVAPFHFLFRKEISESFKNFRFNYHHHSCRI